MSMPADTPAAVTYFPSNTTRSLTGVAPRRPSSSRASQCEVARRPVSSPAAARMSDPVHTEVVQTLVWSAALSHSCTGPSCIWPFWPGPPGTTMTSGCGTSGSPASADRIRPPCSSLIGPGTFGDEGDLRARQAAEHLIGADRVEHGEAVEEQDGNLHDSPPCRACR